MSQLTNAVMGLIALEARAENIDLASMSGKRALIAARCELAEQLRVIRDFAAQDRGVLADKALAGELQSRLSRIRSTAALHQAEWPAVCSTGAPAEYTRSATRLRTAIKDFEAWCAVNLNMPQ